MPTMNSGLGGPAGYGEGVFSTSTGATTPPLGGNLDDGFVALDITSVFGAGGLTFFGTSYTDIFINSNGIITFGSDFTAPGNSGGLASINLPAIVPFWADVDITKGGDIYWDLDPANDTVTITWLDVAPFDGSGTNSFQVVLTDTGGGDFDIEVIYEDIQFATGNNAASGNAITGITDGDTYNNEFDGSDNSAELLAYETNDFGGGDPNGTFVVPVQNGFPEGFGVEGTAGNDTMGLGYTDTDGDQITTSDDLIFGGNGADSIDGDVGNDTIYGGDGDDTISSGSDGGGAGAPTWTTVGAGQTATGTSGPDYFRFTGGANATGTVRFNTGTGTRNGDGQADYLHVQSTADGIDLVVEDFEVGTDKIVLSDDFSVTDSFISGGIANLEVTLNNGNQQFFTIYYPGGSFSLSEVFTTTLPGAPAVTDDDFIYGGDGADTFIVEDDFGTDTIFGGEGGADFDTIDLSGLTSPVTVVFTDEEDGTIADGTDTITFTEIERLILTDGNDTVDASITWDGVFGDNPGVSIEAGGGDDTITGGNGGDSIDGGTGNDSIDGDYGDDILIGGDGNDSIQGGSGNDNISGGNGNDRIDGGIEGDTLYGGADDDTLFGGTGTDTLDGGAGADTLTGGADADVFVVDAGGDTITDFDATTGIGDANSTNNDFVDLTAFYNATTLAAWNAANPGQTYANPVGWMRADQADGTLNEAGNLRVNDSGSQVAASEMNAENTGVVCFANGTRIATAQGEVAVEDIKVGDLVMTLDHGLQHVRWIGARKIGTTELSANAKLRPVRITAGALGRGLPVTDLLVSRQHRMLVASKITKRMFDEREVLVPAIKLVGLQGMNIADDVTELTYYHILFDQHEVIWANGTPSESLYTGTQALLSLSPAARDEILILFPELASPGKAPALARKVPDTGRASKGLLRRHARNKKPLLETFGVQ